MLALAEQFCQWPLPQSDRRLHELGPAHDATTHQTNGLSPALQERGILCRHGGKVAYGKRPDIDAFLGNPTWPRPDDVPKLDAKAPPWDGAALPYDDEETGDYKVSEFAIEQWQTKTEKPLMMAIGLYRPHRPL